MDIPCSGCYDFVRLSNGLYFCSGIEPDTKDVVFYRFSEIDEMINHCPLGYRVYRAGDNFITTKISV